MADSSSNPSDNAELVKLREGLSSFEASLERRLAATQRQIEELQAQVRQTADTTQAARQEGKARATAVGKGGTPGATSPAEITQAASEAERLAQARGAAASAAERETLATARLNTELLTAAERVKTLQGESLLIQAGMRPSPVGAAPTGIAAQAETVAAAARAEQEAQARALSDANRNAIQQARANRYPPAPAINLTAIAAQEQAMAARAAAVGAGAQTSEAEIAQREEALAWTRRAKAGEIDFTNSIRAEGQAWALAGNSLTRHGYLTSEFIQAAVRGQVTFRQLGENVGGTIAKFGGWTAAATSVYAVVGALHELGKGALDAESGVGLVSRIINNLDTEKLRGQFRDLSREFNLPIDQVTQAVYGAAKVYNDQNDAVSAARQILFAMKVGELDAASATRYLTSIVAGFRLEAAQLPDVFDAINQAQNKFGGNTGQMVAGVAKAAGTFRLAGGSYRQLIALIETGQKLTGVTGEAVGTAISRSAGTVLTKQGAARLAAAGLTPGQSYTELLGQAFRASQGASPERVQEIARALVPAGGQFARIFVPILQNRDLYEKVLREITQHGQGSAERELRKALAQPDEQLKSLVNSAQRLGAALGQAGVLAAPFIAVVEPLRLALELATKLTETLNVIPRPIRSAAVGLAEIVALLRLARRFDVGASLPSRAQTNPGGFYERVRTSTGIFGLSRNPEATLNAQIQRDVSDLQGTFGGSLAAARKRTIEARFEAQAALEASVAAQGTEEEVAAGLRLKAAQAAVVRADERAATIVGQLAALAEANTRYLEERKAGATAEVAANRAGLSTTTGTFERGAEAGRYYPVPIGPRGPAGGFTKAEVAAETERAAALASSRSAQWGAAAGSALAPAYQKFRGLLPGGGGAGAAAGAAEEEAGATAAGSSLLSKNALLVGGGLLVLAGTIKSTVDYIGQANDRLKALTDISGGPEAIKKRVEAERKNNVALQGPSARAGSYLSDVVNLRPGQFIEDFATGLGGNTADRINAEVAIHQQAFAESVRRANRKGVALQQGQIAARLKQAQSAAIGPSDEIAALQTALQENAVSYANLYGGKKARAAAAAYKAQLEQQLGQVKAAQGDLRGALSLLTTIPAIQTFATDLDAQFALRTPAHTPGVLYGKANVGLISARNQIALDPTKAADALKQIQTFDNTISQNIQARLDATKYGNPAQNVATRTAALRLAHRAYIGLLPDQISRAQGDLQGLLNEQSAEARPGATGTPDKGLRLRIAQAIRRVQQLKQQLDLGDKAFGDLKRENDRATFEEQQGLYDAQTTLLVTRVGDNPVAQARIQLQRQNARLGAIAAEYTKQSTTYVNAFNQAQQDRQALVTAQLEAFDTGVDLNRARANIGATDQQRQAGSVADALSKYRQAQATLRPGDQRIATALKSYYDALGAQVDSTKQQADDILSAQRELALSTLDPSDQVAAAAVNLRFDRRALTNARTTGDRIRAQATINKDIQTQRDARLAARASTVDYQLSMGQIDQETAAAEYDALARRVRNNKDLLRQYRQKAHELRQAAEGGANAYQLDIGSIKLPTPYEVTRAIKEGRRGTSQYRQSVVNQDNKTTIHITVKDNADLAKVGDVLDTHLNTNTRSALRAQGVLS